MSILMIEDDEGVGPSIAHLLRDEGYDVVIATSGRIALDRLGNHPLPSLILLDLMMPEMDGIEFRVSSASAPPSRHVEPASARRG